MNALHIYVHVLFKLKYSSEKLLSNALSANLISTLIKTAMINNVTSLIEVSFVLLVFSLCGLFLINGNLIKLH